MADRTGGSCGAPVGLPGDCGARWGGVEAGSGPCRWVEAPRPQKNYRGAQVRGWRLYTRRLEWHLLLWVRARLPVCNASLLKSSWKLGQDFGLRPGCKPGAPALPGESQFSALGSAFPSIKWW